MKLKISFKRGIRLKWAIDYYNDESHKFLQYKTLSLQFINRPYFWLKGGGYGTWQWPWFTLIFAWMGIYYSHDYKCHVKGESGPVLVKSTNEGEGCKQIIKLKAVPSCCELNLKN